MENLSSVRIFEHLLRIEKELTELRQVLLTGHGSELAKRSPGSLRGVWRGTTLDEQDFAEAKVSLFPEKNL
jgi:hypothetical protein